MLLKTLYGQSQGLSPTVKEQEVYQDPGEDVFHATFATNCVP
jgi:hypothetical protein